MTLLCVPIFVESPDAALADAVEALHRGADLIELRIDPYYTGTDDDQQIEAIVDLVSACPLPCIVTCRPVLEGGQYDGPDDARISLLERLCAGFKPGEHPPRYIDVELATYQRSENIKQKVNLCVDHPGQLRQTDTGLILSAHDFQTRPETLFRQISAMATEPASKVSKVAYRARSLRDNLELLDLLIESRKLGRPMIALAMGQFGMMSRILAPKFDGFLTFASLRKSSGTAPGQPTLDELLNTYRFRSIGATTRVFGVVGWPVDHSISPFVHNAGFEARGVDAVYLHMPVAPGPESLKATLLSMIDHPQLDLAGCSVTIPHKENLAKLAQSEFDDGDGRWSADDLTRATGAGNTLHIIRDARGVAESLRVCNTDGPAMAKLLHDALGTLVGKTVLILGAGGTARSIAGAVVLAGGRVVVTNRTPERAAQLASELRSSLRCDERHLRAVESSSLQALFTSNSYSTERLSAVCQATSAGLASGPDAGALPLDEDLLTQLFSSAPPGLIVAESVYKPLRTPFLELAQSMAERLSIQTIDGLRLFVEQAALQCELWTGQPAPRALFVQVAREALQLDEGASRN